MMRIAPAGIGDLKVIKKKLVGYDDGELAHIENVLKGETRNHDTRRLRERETFVSAIDETIRETEKDLQTTERFEIENEMERSARNEETVQAGVSLSASYGPVSLSAYARYGNTSTTEESSRTATSFAKETVERSLSRLKSRTLRERATRNLEVFEDKNHHGFTNIGADATNTSGIYRWVDKFYRHRVVNYGKRLMFEFVVPEPAAFFKHAAAEGIANGDLPVRPEEPRLGTGPGVSILLRPDFLREDNYVRYVQEYRAQGVRPPPPQRVILARAFAKEMSNDRPHSIVSSDVDIPEGYGATSASLIIRWGRGVVFPRPAEPEEGITLLPSAWLFVLIGQNTLRRLPSDVVLNGGRDFVTLSGETGTLPVTVMSGFHRHTAVHVEIECTRTPETMQKWQLETYAAIMSAYRRQLLDYQEAVAAARVQGGVTIQGRNPEINRRIEREELKRACISMWTGAPITTEDGVRTWDPTASSPPVDYPEVDTPAALRNAPWIDFLEQAFDWANAIYEFYPYFYARRELWSESYGLEDVDPIFERFLRAGAARVVVPVQPSYSGAVLYYQQTGLLWNGEDVPAFDPDTADGALYNEYLADLAKETDVVDIDRDVDIDPEDPETWVVKVPTNLVHLQSSDELPYEE